MTPSKEFSLRFYIRKKAAKPDDPVPLRLSVWVAATKSYLYLTTNVRITPKEWEMFTCDGRAKNGAAPNLIAAIDRYRVAVSIVVNSYMANNKWDALASNTINPLVTAMVRRMEENDTDDTQLPVVVLTSPNSVSLCRTCEFQCGDCCLAAFMDAIDNDIAPDLALYNGQCTMYQPKTTRQ